MTERTAKVDVDIDDVNGFTVKVTDPEGNSAEVCGMPGEDDPPLEFMSQLIRQATDLVRSARVAQGLAVGDT